MSKGKAFTDELVPKELDAVTFVVNGRHTPRAVILMHVGCALLISSVENPVVSMMATVKFTGNSSCENALKHRELPSSLISIGPGGPVENNDHHWHRNRVYIPAIMILYDNKRTPT